MTTSIRYIFETPRLKINRNRLAEKRRLDKIQQQVDGVKFKANCVATAITRLSTAGLISSPEMTPDTPTRRTTSGVDLTLSGTKRRRENSTEIQIFLEKDESMNRLSSIKLER